MLVQSLPNILAAAPQFVTELKHLGEGISSRIVITAKEMADDIIDAILTATSSFTGQDSSTLAAYLGYIEQVIPVSDAVAMLVGYIVFKLAIYGMSLVYNLVKMVPGIG